MSWNARREEYMNELLAERDAYFRAPRDRLLDLLAKHSLGTMTFHYGVLTKYAKEIREALAPFDLT